MERKQFFYSDLKKLLPKKYSKINNKVSLAYFFWDVLLILSLFFFASKIDAFYLWPLYWIAQGTMLFALFTIGHDCGHDAFLNSKKLNTVFGHLCMAPVLIPYYSWRISHNSHHVNSGHGVKEDAWRPYTREHYFSMRIYEKIFRHTACLLFALPLYLIFGTSRRRGSFFSPNTSLFKKKYRRKIAASTISVIFMLGAIVIFSIQYGAYVIVKFYVIPYIVFIVWFDLVTFLHHTDKKIPWYIGKHWTFVKGALATKDRSYGIFDHVIHNIGTHTVHHLFPGMPHYYLKPVTNIIRPHLGKQYLYNDISAISDLRNSIKNCRFIEDELEGTHYYKNQ